MPLWFVFIAITLLLTYKEKKMRMAAAAFGLFSMIYFVVLFAFIIPAFEIPGPELLEFCLFRPG